MANSLLPNKQPTLRVMARSAHANSNGTIFGGWVMAQLDIAGSIPAIKTAKGAVATVAASHMRFSHPLFVHDIVSLYAHVVKIGHTSITVDIDLYVQRLVNDQEHVLKAAEATLIYVAIAAPGEKRAVPKP